ncbi:TIGR02444 family protein [Novosphingobium sp. Gsoil 351]|uniref:TIGR02444 family protein n=1 Tax=Novosphingobium sp. Gsoil 351 TaxID=2675225 RepID=UPI0012B4B5D1|nr:TIGR02444 family protein [Novosphingobium sp. Gsoil 351]QGN54031.1 TIGR02444 family protein [Novosphingobium sp. Gsoil 351]
MNSSASASGPFWQFSLEVYARPQVADLCLGLQDEYGFDVNIVLLCLWLARDEGRTVSLTEIQTLRAGVAELNENLVWPIRQARRWARTRIDVAPDSQAQAECREIYASLKAIELRGERCVQLVLLECLRWVGMGCANPADMAARASLESYRQAIAAPDATGAILAQLTVKAFA